MSKTKTYKPSKDIWEVSRQLNYDVPLEADDPRLVDTQKGRGDFSFAPLLRILGVDPKTMRVKSPNQQKYILFTGHRGCGKSTELRRLARELHHPSRFFVVFLDSQTELNIDNLQYADVLVAAAKKLCEALQGEGITVADEFLSKLRAWFQERIEKHEKIRDLTAEVRSEAQAGVNFPFIARLFSVFSASIKNNSRYTEEIRQVIHNNFSDFAVACNDLIDAARELVKKEGKGQSILFIVDGPDKISSREKRLDFFIHNAWQLQQIESNFIYTAPIDLVHEEGGQLRQVFGNIVTLPMIKLRSKESVAPLDEGYACMRELIHRRADPSLFDDQTTLDYLIEYSGGNPRHLLRLLDYAFQAAEDDRFDRAAAETAVRKMAREFAILLTDQHYALLRKIDQAPQYVPATVEEGKIINYLLYHLCLLQYNDFWWLSHPAIRTLPAYDKA